MPKKKIKVAVAFSSGVDSSVAAILLKKQGYAVEGIFLDFSSGSQSGKIGQSRSIFARSLFEAEKTARFLDIPLSIVDATEEFEREVVDYFLRENNAGRTPNPCVVCNQKIKFKLLLEKMSEAGFDFLATGHYARVVKKRQDSGEEIFSLFSGRDEKKDQAYFLYTLGREQLAKIIFPVGEMTKEDVKKVACELNLPIFDKKESQDLCFLGKQTAENFLCRHLRLKSGEIRNTQGEKVGMHAGLALYTLGQRRGVNIGGSGPYYVVRKNYRDNVLMVSDDKDDKNLFRKEIFLKNVNWPTGRPLLPLKTLIRSRYRGQLAIGTVIEAEKMAGFYQVIFKNPQKAITPGQVAVFYSEDGEVLGGGEII